MAKKILKRGLALGALMAFVITGSAMAEKVSVISDTKAFNDLSVENDVFQAADNRVIGLHVEGSTLELNGSSNISAIEDNQAGGGKGTQAIKINDGTNINVNGNLTVYSEANYGQFAAGLVTFKNTINNFYRDVTINGINNNKLNKNDNSNIGWLAARTIAYDAELGAITNFYGTTKITAEGNSFNEAIYSYQASTVFHGDAIITATSSRQNEYGEDVRVINLEGDPPDQHNTNLEFKGNYTSISGSGNSVMGIFASGGPDKINATFSGKTVDIKTTGDNYSIALYAQYGGKIVSSKDTDINISAESANGDAYAVFSTYTWDYPGVIELLGNTNITAKGNTSSHALHAEDDGKITIGSSGKTVSLTGDVFVDGGIININGSDIVLNGSIENKGYKNVYDVDTANDGDFIYVDDNFVKPADGIYESGATRYKINNLVNSDSIININGISNAIDGDISVYNGGEIRIIDAEKTVVEGSISAIGKVVIEGKELQLTGNIASNGEYTYEKHHYINSDIEKESYSGVSEISITNTNSVIKGDISANNKGIINISGEKVDLTGKVTTASDSIAKLSLGKGTWNITDASTLTDVTFGAGSTLMIDNGSKYTGGKYAVTASGKAEVEDGAKLVVNGVKEETYNIVKAGTINGKWAESDITIDNALMSYEWSAEGASKLDLVVKPKSADEITNSTGVNSSTGSMLSDVVNMASSNDYNKGDNAGVDFIVNAMAGQASGNTPEGAGTAINSALQIGEAGGNSGTALSVVNNVAGVTTQRLSFSQMNTAPQGGHGKVERKYKSGAGVWAQYMHGKDKVEDMPMDSLKSSYESQYNGAVIGYDFKEVGKTQTGIAFNYGEGDSHSTGGSIATRSDFDFWGIGLYHNIMNDDTNLILDVNYSKSDSDVTQINGGTTLTANPETTTLSAGVKFEKLIQNGPVQIVPYAGLRFMSVDTDDYAANIAGKKAFMYAPDRQNIWLIPVGVSLRQENTYENGWRVTPKADLSYIWAVGDTDSSMTVSIPGITNVANMNYTVMDNGSFLGTVGIEAEKGDWTYGLSYSYQKGEYQRSDKWFVDVRYSF